MKICIEKGLEEILRLGVMGLRAIKPPADRGDALWREMESLSQRLRVKFQGKSPSQIPGVAQTRILFRRAGLDPTRRRPSSEALLRRAIQGKPLYRIRPIVDLFNIVSLEALLPVGLYDESKISGDTINACVGQAGWHYPGIRKDRVNVGGRLCLADDLGPFGSPISDSLRTAIDGDVPAVVAIFFQFKDGDRDDLNRVLDRAEELAGRHLHSDTTFRQFLPS